MIDIICAAIAASGAIIIAVIGKNIKDSNEKIDKRADIRRQESLLSLRMMDATLQLSVVTSNALTGGHNNGNVEKARVSAENVAKDYEDFMRKVTADRVGE